MLPFLTFTFRLQQSAGLEKRATANSPSYNQTMTRYSEHSGHSVERGKTRGTSESSLRKPEMLKPISYAKQSNNMNISNENESITSFADHKLILR